MTVLDGSKLKSDLANVIKTLPNLVPKEDIERITEDVKKFRIEIADSTYEMQSVKDSIAKVEKLVETNQKEIKLSMQNARVKAESTEKSVAGNKSAIKELNEKVKNFIKNAALSGNTSMGEGNLVQEIENNIQKLRDDLDDLKKYSDQE